MHRQYKRLLGVSRTRLRLCLGSVLGHMHVDSERVNPPDEIACYFTYAIHPLTV